MGVLLDFGVAEYGVRGASGWTTDSVRDGVVGEQRLNKHCCIGELRLIRVFIGVAPDNLTGELLSWKEIIGSGAEIGECYAHGTNWHLTVSDPKSWSQLDSPKSLSLLSGRRKDLGRCRSGW